MKKLFLIATFALLLSVGLRADRAFAASRFWVGGTGTWDAVTTTHWAASSGGAGGQSVPGSGDTVTIDGSSGGGTVTLGTSPTISAFTQSAATFNDGGLTLTVSGNLTLTGGTYTSTGTLSFTSVSGTTIACNNAVFNLVSFPSSGDSTLTINSDCSLPLGANPTMARTQSNQLITLHGTLSGTGTLTIQGHTFASQALTTDSSNPFSGFTNVTLQNMGNMTISGGTFTAPSGTLTLNRGLTISGGTFNANGGTVAFASNTGGLPVIACNNAVFNLVTLVIPDASFTINSDCSLPLGNNPSINATASNNTLTLHGTLSGTGTLTATGSTGNGFTFSTDSTNPLSGFTAVTGSHMKFTVTSGTCCGSVAFTTDNAVTTGANNVNWGSFTSSGAGNISGTGTWTFTGTGTVFSMGSGTTTGFTGTMRVTDASSAAKTFAGNGKTYGNLTFAGGAGGGSYTITGANTFATFSDSGTVAHSITFPNVTTTFTTFSVSGRPHNLITLQRTGGAGTFTLSNSSGSNCVDYLSISNSVATGGGSWFAGLHSTDGGGNTGWIFSGSGSCPTTHSTGTLQGFFKTIIKRVKTIFRAR